MFGRDVDFEDGAVAFGGIAACRLDISGVSYANEPIDPGGRS